MLFTTMAFTLAFSGNSSILTNEYFPPLQLDKDYVCGLIDLQTYYTIPNVDKSNNLLHVGNHIIQISVGSYELDDISDYLSNYMTSLKPPISNFSLEANNNTLKCEIRCSEPIYFNRRNSIGSLLGFRKRILEPNKLYQSDEPVNISNINVIRVECNITTGSYFNGKPTHTIHEFAPEVEPGYKIVEVPKNVIYLPVTVQQISSITLKLVDQNNNLINFQGENISIRLHLIPSNNAHLQ